MAKLLLQHEVAIKLFYLVLYSFLYNKSLKHLTLFFEDLQKHYSSHVSWFLLEFLCVLFLTAMSAITYCLGTLSGNVVVLRKWRKLCWNLDITC